MSERQHITVIVEGMEYQDETWTAKGRVQMANGREFSWTASHIKSLTVKIDEVIYSEALTDQVRKAIKSALGMINLPYSKAFEIRTR